VAEKGNWRIIQPINKQDVKLISTSPEKAKKGSYETEMIFLIVALVLFTLSFFFLLMVYCGQKKTIQQL